MNTKSFSSELEALIFIKNNYLSDVKNFDIQFRVIDDSNFKKFNYSNIYDYLKSIIENYKFLVIDTFSLNRKTNNIYLFDNEIRIM